jgi:hypothetical protein
MIGTLSDPRRLAAGTPGAQLARAVRRRPTRIRSRARSATTDRASPAPCLGLALAAGAALWAALGGTAFLLAG